MASLYIKDKETAALATEVARHLGTTKTEAVRLALREKKASFRVEEARPDFIEWLRERRKTHPLPPRVGHVADKAFYDELSGEDPD